MALLTCRDLALGYDGREVVRGLRFEVNAGDYLCIVGENGSGKSTLMKTILGLQPPLSGAIETGDGFSLGEIGYLPQQTLVQRDFPASVWEIVLSGCLGRRGWRPWYSEADKKRARDTIEKLELTPLIRRCYRELSGGQQQRVLLARALCATERVLLLDEPVAGLDPKVTAEMYDVVARLNREEGVTILMVSHDVDAALTYATHVLHIGHQIFFGTREDYVASEAARGFLRGGEAK
ncbi:MAG: metal ABC transporter ATP-binding protein [Clostridia bacterium]|nr:metal ABC transporter ATP-binding protein [Clostridia bacterium]